MTLDPQRPSPAPVAVKRLPRTAFWGGGGLKYATLTLVATSMTIIVLLLWTTEPALPLRTQLAFGALSGIGGAWIAFSTWAPRIAGPSSVDQ
jgi:hypothetical protein